MNDSNYILDLNVENIDMEIDLAESQVTQDVSRNNRIQLTDGKTNNNVLISNNTVTKRIHSLIKTQFQQDILQTRSQYIQFGKQLYEIMTEKDTKIEELNKEIKELNEKLIKERKETTRVVELKERIEEKLNETLQDKENTQILLNQKIDSLIDKNKSLTELNNSLKNDYFYLRRKYNDSKKNLNAMLDHLNDKYTKLIKKETSLYDENRDLTLKIVLLEKENKNLSDMKCTINGVQQKADSLDEENKELKGKLIELRENFDKADKDYKEKLQVQNVKYLDEKQAKNDALRAKLELEKQCLASLEKIGLLESTLNSYETDKDELCKEIEKMKKEYQMNKLNTDHLLKELSEANIKLYLFDNLKKMKDTLENENKSLKDEIKSLEADKEKLKDHLKKLIISRRNASN